MHFERWRHAFGCGKWFHAARCTVTLEVFATYSAQTTEPPRKIIDAIKARRPLGGLVMIRAIPPSLTLPHKGGGNRPRMGGRLTQFVQRSPLSPCGGGLGRGGSGSAADKGKLQ